MYAPKKTSIVNSFYLCLFLLLLINGCSHDEHEVPPKTKLQEATLTLQELAKDNSLLIDKTIIWDKGVATELHNNSGVIISFPVITSTSQSFQKLVYSKYGEQSSVGLWTLVSSEKELVAADYEKSTHDVLKGFSGEVTIVELTTNEIIKRRYANGSIQGVANASGRTQDGDWPAACASCHNATWLPEVPVYPEPDPFPNDPYDPCTYAYNPCTCDGIGCPVTGPGPSPGNNPNDELTNNVDDPCMKQAVNNAISSNLSNELSSLMQSIFNINEDINIEFDQAVLAPDLDAETNATGGGGSPPSVLNVTITLNSSILPNASQEYIMSTVYHEIVHAILNYNGVSKNDQHPQMANDYVTRLSAALLEHYPQLSAADATDLSWAGLQGTAAWNSLSAADQNRINNLNKDHRVHSSGTPCP